VSTLDVPTAGAVGRSVGAGAGAVGVGAGAVGTAAVAVGAGGGTAVGVADVVV
jgi:hypothetical protein